MKAFFSEDYPITAVPIRAYAMRAVRVVAAEADVQDDDGGGRGDETEQWFDLGIAYSTGTHGRPCDLVEAHKWFNIAASRGHGPSARCRGELAGDMTAREIADAQRRARAWLRGARAAA